MNELLLLKKMLAADWIGVKAMVSPGIRDALLDIVFITTDGGVRLIGKAHSLRDKPEEAFSLAIYEQVKSGWWQEDEQGRTKWKPRDLREEWMAQSLHSVLAQPRNVHFYSDPRLKERKFPVQCVLDNCTAIRLLKEGVEGGTKEIVFAASNNYPCSIEMGTTRDSCNALLSGLYEVGLNTA